MLDMSDSSDSELSQVDIKVTEKKKPRNNIEKALAALRAKRAAKKSEAKEDPGQKKVKKEKKEEPKAVEIIEPVEAPKPAAVPEQKPEGYLTKKDLEEFMKSMRINEQKPSNEVSKPAAPKKKAPVKKVKKVIVQEESEDEEEEVVIVKRQKPRQVVSAPIQKPQPQMSKQDWLHSMLFA